MLDNGHCMNSTCIWVQVEFILNEVYAIFWNGQTDLVTILATAFVWAQRIHTHSQKECEEKKNYLRLFEMLETYLLKSMGVRAR